ncbi:hypothetical protein KM043_006468 [Ampulex compressa]|nr:hypothetical protein KM043_006468 [Ampulex compressa]
MNTILLIITALCVFGISKLVGLLYQHYIFRKQYKGFPTYPPGFLSFGILLKAASLPREGLVRWLVSNCSMTKDGFYLAWFGYFPVIFVHQPKHLEMIFSDVKSINKSFTYLCLKEWLGEGLLTSSGSKWFHDRKLLTPTFHFDVLNGFTPIVFEKTQIFIERLEKELSKNPKAPIDIVKPVGNYTLDVICETAMGINLNVQCGAQHEYSKNLHKYSTIVFNRIVSPLLMWRYIYAISPQGFVGRATLKAMHKFIEKVISERKLARIAQRDTKERENRDGEGKRKRKAFLDLLLDLSDNQERSLTNKAIRNQVHTFMFEGHDTTASALIFALFCLGSYPDVQEKVHQEIEEVFGDSKEQATLQQIHQLQYLGRVIKESLRLYTTVPIIGRQVEEEIVIGDYTVPRGTHVLILASGTHRDPNHWPDPEKFDPDRFLPENIENRHPYAYIPFSAGYRNCIGQKLSQLEEKILLTEILRKWRIKSAESPENLIIHPHLVSKPVNSVHVYFTPKH